MVNNHKINDLYDVTIIGGGPAGLYSAFYSGLRGLKTKIIEFQPKLGGKVQIYPEKIIWDVGGVPPISGEKFINSIITQGLTFQPDVFLNSKVISISKDKNFEIITEDGAHHLSKTVIIAVGGGIITPQKLTIEGAERFEVSNLHYTITSLERFRNKKVLVSGGGNTAVDWANELVPIAKKVYVTYRNEELKGHEAQVQKLLNSSASCYLKTSITKLISSESKDLIGQVELEQLEDKGTFKLDVDEVLINHGYERDAELITKSPLQISMKDDYCVAGDSNGRTTVEGVYAAGDILHHEGKLHLIAGAFQDAANAVNQAKLYIQPEATKSAMVSSHNDAFKERNEKIKRKEYY